MINRSMIRLIQMFPRTTIQQPDINDFNHHISSEIQHIRQFNVLHYHVTHPQDTTI